MAFPTFVGHGGAVQESVNSLTVTDHANTASGDYQLLVIETMDEAATLSTAAGYTEHPGSPVSAPSGTATIATRLTVFERIWNGTDGDPTIADPGNHVIANIFTFRRSSGTWASLADARSPVDGTGWKATAETTEDTSGSMDGVTTDTADQLIIGVIAAAKPDVAGGTAEMSAITNANLANITERHDDAAASGNGGWIGAWTGEEATSGQAIGATTWTKAAASYKAMLVVAIRDSAPAAGDSITAAGAIASAEAFGIATIRRIASPLAIASAEAFGTHNVRRVIQPQGIGSAEAFGMPNLLVKLITSAGGIGSAESVGEPRLTRLLHPVAVASGEAFGQANLIRQIRLAGSIPSEEALGEPRALVLLRPVGIGSAEVFGQGNLTRILSPLGLVSQEAFGVARALFVLRPLAIASVEDFGVATLTVLAAPGGPAVFGQTLLTDGSRFGLLVSDQGIYLVEVTDQDRFGTVLADQPGG